jgi:hypothetical protein
MITIRLLSNSLLVSNHQADSNEETASSNEKMKTTTTTTTDIVMGETPRKKVKRNSPRNNPTKSEADQNSD